MKKQFEKWLECSIELVSCLRKIICSFSTTYTVTSLRLIKMGRCSIFWRRKRILVTLNFRCMFSGSLTQNKILKLLKRYGNRFVLMHLKDMKQGTPRNLLGETDIENNVSLGQGIIQWADVTPAAKEAGVKRDF